MSEARRFAALDRASLVAALLLVVALGALWAWDRSRPVPVPEWDPARFVPLRPPDSLGATRERWIVAVQPSCGACGRHLRWLVARLRERAEPPALGVLVVDEPARPAAPVAEHLPAGVWWDRAGHWRRTWGRRRYGETYRFDAGGRLLGVSPAGTLPDSAAANP